MQAYLICFALLTYEPTDVALRGCALLAHSLEAAERFNHDPYLFMALGWKETRFTPWLRGRDTEGGAWQTKPRYVGLTHAELVGQPGAWAGADMFKRFGRRPMFYNCGRAGSCRVLDKKTKRCLVYRQKCLDYERAVLAKYKEWTTNATPRRR